MPFQLRLFLTDLKGGIEFYDYNGLPHLGGDAYWTFHGDDIKTFPRDYRPEPGQQLRPPQGDQIYTDPAHVLPMLKYCEAEMDRRTRLIAPTRARNIKAYNKKFPDKALSYWLIIIDELATMMEDSRYKKQAELSLNEIARKGRAAGIYLVLATQTPTSKVIPSQLGGNMDARIAFRAGSGAASGVLLGDGQYDAVRLPPVEGRFIWKWGTEKFQIQGPLITENAIAALVAEAKASHYIDPAQAELAQKADHLFRIALRLCEGRCQSNDIYAMVKPDGFKKSEVLKILDQYQVDHTGQPEIRIDDTIYYLAPPIQAKRVPRWLVPAGNFENKQHPSPDYDFDLLVFRVPFSENVSNTVSPKSKDPTTPGENEPISPLANFPTEPLAPSVTLPANPIGQPANGSNGHNAGRNRDGSSAAPSFNRDQPGQEVPAWISNL